MKLEVRFVKKTMNAGFVCLFEGKLNLTLHFLGTTVKGASQLEQDSMQKKYSMQYSFKSHLFKFLELKSSEKNLLGVLHVKEINPEYSLEGLMLKLKLQYFGHLLGRADSLEETLMFRKIEGRRRRQQVTEDETVGWHHRLNGRGSEQTPGDGAGQGSLACCSLQVTKSRTRLSD